jgi:hypothetical protein
MATDDLRERWNRDAHVLAQIGAELFAQTTRLTVRLPKALADEALDAWNREDVESSDDEREESADEQSDRHRAGSLALIGAAIEKRGAADGDEHVTVELDAWFVGHALDAADDGGLIQ